MKLNISQISEITGGAVRIIGNEDEIRLYRFTEEQEQLYHVTNPENTQIFSSTGMKLSFKTDSSTLNIRVYTERLNIRNFFSVDVFVNGKVFGYIDNLGSNPLPENYIDHEYPQGEFGKVFKLGSGVKEICVYFPWSVTTVIKEISVDDGAFVESTLPKKRLMVFGDSITVGENAIRPSVRYPARLAEQLGAQEFNKAISGDHFFPPLADTQDDFTPDYILVTCGTNDWAWGTKEEYIKKCRDFFVNIRKHYLDVPIYAVSPIWRADLREKGFCDFEDISGLMIDTLSGINGITVIPGDNLVSHDRSFFSDKRLHPNDKGFDCYYNSLKQYFVGK